MATFLDLRRRADGWPQVAFAQPPSTLHNCSGTRDTQRDMPWGYSFVRHCDAEPWRIIDQGMG